MITLHSVVILSIYSVKSKLFEVKIPKGVDTDSIIRIYPDKSSELLIRIQVLSNDKFIRKGDNLYMDIYVPFEDLIIGGEAEVQTLINKVNIKFSTIIFKCLNLDSWFFIFYFY